MVTRAEHKAWDAAALGVVMTWCSVRVSNFFPIIFVNLSESVS